VKHITMRRRAAEVYRRRSQRRIKNMDDNELAASLRDGSTAADLTDRDLLRIIADGELSRLRNPDAELLAEIDSMIAAATECTAGDTAAEIKDIIGAAVTAESEPADPRMAEAIGSAMNNIGAAAVDFLTAHDVFTRHLERRT
jgi:hypothetical protein